MKKIFALLVVAVACLPLATGCAVETDDPPPSAPVVDDDTDDTETQDNSDDVETGSCETDDTRSCKVQINADNCFVGEQVCEFGAWGDCL